MLKRLDIHNLAIVDHQSIDFETGFTVITGENWRWKIGNTQRNYVNSRRKSRCTSHSTRDKPLSCRSHVHTPQGPSDSGTNQPQTNGWDACNPTTNQSSKKKYADPQRPSVLMRHAQRLGPSIDPFSLSAFAATAHNGL